RDQPEAPTRPGAQRKRSARPSGDPRPGHGQGTGQALPDDGGVPGRAEVPDAQALPADGGGAHRGFDDASPAASGAKLVVAQLDPRPGPGGAPAAGAR